VIRERVIRGLIFVVGVGIFLYTVISSAPVIPSFVGGVALVIGLTFGLTSWARLRERFPGRFGRDR
jgi:hypothetical protein